MPITTAATISPETSIVNRTASAEWRLAFRPPKKSAEPQQAEAASANAIPTPVILPVGLSRRIDQVGGGLHGGGRDRAGDRQRPQRLRDLRPGVVDRMRLGLWRRGRSGRRRC